MLIYLTRVRQVPIHTVSFSLANITWLFADCTHDRLHQAAGRLVPVQCFCYLPCSFRCSMNGDSNRLVGPATWSSCQWRVSHRLPCAQSKEATSGADASGDTKSTDSVPTSQVCTAPSILFTQCFSCSCSCCPPISVAALVQASVVAVQEQTLKQVPPPTSAG